MLFKIDENLHPDVASVLREHGHDAVTVWDQGLRGTSDVKLSAVCRSEHRALITLDLDFADIRAYPPEDYDGIMVLRLSRQDKRHVVNVVKRVVGLLQTEPLSRHLWVVDEANVRIRGKDEDASGDEDRSEAT